MNKLFTAALLASAALICSPRAGAQEHAPEAATHQPTEHEQHHDAHAAGAHAGGPFELRLSLEAPLFQHASVDGVSASTNIFKTVDLGVSAMLSYIVVPQKFSIDFEVTESFLLAAESAEEGAPKRSGTTLRVGASFTPNPEVPFYLTALTTYHLEPSPFVFGLRVGMGTELHITPSAKYFVELDLDFPLAGGPFSAFQSQAIVLATGVLFHLP